MPSMQSSSSTSRSGQQSQTRIVPGMLDYSKHMTGLNMQNYENILSGYGNSQAMLAAGMNASYAGYNQLSDSAMHMMGVDGGGWGIATPAANRIRQDSTQTQGQTQQRMINAGLGNSTVLASMANQNRLQTNQAYGELGANLANHATGIMTQIGLARMQANTQILGMQANASNNYISTLGGYRFGNTVGDLTGQFSQGYSNANSQSQGMATGDPMMGGARGGGGGGGITSRAADPYFGGGGQPYSPYSNDLTAINYAATRPQSFGYSGSSNVLNLSGGYGPQWSGMDPTQGGGGYNPYGPRGGGRTSSIA